MKNKLKVLGITIILMLTSAISVYANTEATLTMSVDKNEVKVGETFTVTLKATCLDGINGVVTTYSYDESKLEYVSENVVDNNYAFGGNKDAKEIFVYCTSTDSIQNADVYALTFRVKEGVEANASATISITEATLDSDAASNSEHTIQSQEISVKIVETTDNEGEEQKPPVTDNEGEEQKPPVTDNEGEEQKPPVTDNEGGEQKPPVTDNEGGEQKPPVTDNEGGEQKPPVTDNEGGEQKPPVTDNEGGEQKPPVTDNEGEEQKPPVTDNEENKDETITDKNYNKAGFNPTIVISIAITMTIAFAVYLKNKKYEDIR